MSNFTHLHVHTDYSLLDGATKISELAEYCSELGMTAVAITDHGVMYGVYQFIQTMQKKGIKPIVGCEFYVCDDMHDKGSSERNKKREHLVLLAKNEKGYHNLIKLDSVAFTEGFYYKPRVDMELIKKYSDNLICLTGCLAGRIPQLLLKGNYEKAKEELLSLKEIFKDDLYLEIQDHGMQEQKQIIPSIIKLSKETGVKIVATNDTHYLKKEDAEMHDVVLCMQTGKKVSDVDRMRFPSSEFYLKTEEEMLDLFSYLPEAVYNTKEIEDKVESFRIVKRRYIPEYKAPNGMDSYEFLEKMTFDGLKRRYGEVTEKHIERAKYELSIVKNERYVDYFLIVWDFIDFAKRNDIPVGPGRGSGVGSLVAYSIGITDVDPLRYNLFFERFLNPERVSMPDFDIDFCVDRRGEVINYVIEKYGAPNVSQIITFGRLASKAAVKDVARVYDLPFAEVNKLTKLIPSNPALHVTLHKIFVMSLVHRNNPPKTEKEQDCSVFYNPELIELYNSDEMLKKVIDMAMRVEGMPKNTSMHAAGVVICADPISDHVPLQVNHDEITTQYNMTEIESVGLLKMDFLGLRTLTDIKGTLNIIKEMTGKEIDLNEEGYDDPEVYKLISSGETDAVFQLESEGMKKFMQKMKPESMEDIIAGISLYRPGPINSIDEYIRRKNNPDKIKYDHPILEKILDVTYGIIVYQEQVMQIVRELAGFSLGQADEIRRAMSKKKTDEMRTLETKFIYGFNENGKSAVGALKNGIPLEVAKKVLVNMIEFAKYAFNKSHATAYAAISYQTAYLKRYYLEEFITAVLNNRIQYLEEITKYTSYAKLKGIPVLPPDINKSFVKFTVGMQGDKKAIRFGLSALKNVGVAATEAIIKERKQNGDFVDLYDFLYRNFEVVNKRMIESLIKAGAFDCFGKTRAQLMAVFDRATDIAGKQKKLTGGGQLTFFEDTKVFEPIKIDYPDIKEFDNITKLSFEKEVLGVYASGHPLDDYMDFMNSFDVNSSMMKGNDEKVVDEFNEEGDEFLIEDSDSGLKSGDYVRLAGLLIYVKSMMSKQNRRYAVGKIEDLYGQIDIFLGANVYEKYRDLLVEGSILIFNGTVSERNDGGFQVDVKRIAKKDTIRKQETEAKTALFIKNLNRQDYSDVETVIERHYGNIPVYVEMGGKKYKMKKTVEVNDTLKIQLGAIVDEENIIIVPLKK